MPHRHYRIGHYADSAGDTADVVMMLPPVPWYCGVCAEKNDDGGSHCHRCSSAHGDWMCPCSHKNKRGSRYCEVCGNEKPEDIDGD